MHRTSILTGTFAATETDLTIRHLDVSSVKSLGGRCDK